MDIHELEKFREDIQTKKNVSIRALPELPKPPPPHPPIRATLPTLSAVATIDETFT